MSVTNSIPFDETIVSNDSSGEHRKSHDVRLNQDHVDAFTLHELAGMCKLFRRQVDGGNTGSPLGESNCILRAPTRKLEDPLTPHITKQPELPLARNQRSEVNVVGGDHGAALVPVGHLVPPGP